MGISSTGKLEISESFEGQEHSGTVHEGDAVVFTAFAPHRALPNRSERIRLSLDFRFQPLSDPGTDLVFGDFCPAVDQSWEAIYAGSNIPPELQYYWRRERLALQAHDDTHFYQQVRILVTVTDRSGDRDRSFRGS